MSDDELNIRLTKLEIKFDSFKEHHDETAREFRQTVESAIMLLTSKIDRMPCPDHVEEIRRNSDFRKSASWYIRAIIASIVGVIVNMWITK